MIAETWPAVMADHGWQARAARALGVDRATICRDVDVLLADVLGVGGYRLLRALTWTPAERRTLARVELASD